MQKRCSSAKGMLGDIPFKFVLAGDVVSKKKPDPEIYLLALENSVLDPEKKPTRNATMTVYCGLNN